MDIVIAAVTHKNCKMPEDPLYFPVMAGAVLMDEVPDGFMRDDTGDNISSLNRMYCELTGLYWAWKNIRADYLGLCHYRRYFASSKVRGIRIPLWKKARMNSFYRILGYEEASALLTYHDAVLPRPRHYYIETNYSHYVNAHNAQDLDITREVICDLYPEYTEAFDARMHMKSGHRFNMFIMKHDLADRYCRWLFDILFELEKRLDMTGYTDRDRRVFGFVAERLLDVWIDANKIGYVEIPYMMTEPEHLPAKGIRMIIRKLIRRRVSGSRRESF